MSYQTSLRNIGVTDKNATVTLSPPDVLKAVAGRLQLNVADILGVSRLQELVFARHVAIWLLRRHLDMPYALAAVACGRKDHTTAMHAVARIDDRLAGHDRWTTLVVRDLERRLGFKSEEAA